MGFMVLSSACLVVGAKPRAGRRPRLLNAAVARRADPARLLQADASMSAEVESYRQEIDRNDEAVAVPSVR
jgi:hypothetical protein